MLDVIPNPLCAAKSFLSHKDPSYSLLMIYLACAAIEVGYSYVRRSMGRSSVLLKASPTLGPSAVGDSPSPLQHLQAQAGTRYSGSRLPACKVMLITQL